MQYVFFICTDETAEQPPAEDNVNEWVDEMEARGARTLGNALLPPAESKTVKIRKGDLVVTDGPFTETKEWIAGFDVIECADFDEAIEIASKHPMAKNGQIEIRQVMLFD